jgi:hypothetical protein
MSDITKLVPVPPKDSINGNVHSCPTSAVIILCVQNGVVG